MTIGLPGSGKSTFIKKLVSYLDDKPVVLSTDDIIQARADATGVTYSQMFDTFSFGVFKTEMEVNAASARVNGKSVIIDQTNMGSKSRRTKLEPFVKAGYVCASLNFDVPMTVLFERLEKRAMETGKVIPQKVVFQMLGGYTPPTKAEGFDHIWDYEQ